MWRYYRDPVIIAASEIVFGQALPWVPKISGSTAPTDVIEGHLVELLETPLLRVLGYRNYILKQLINKKKAASSEMEEDWMFRINLDYGWSHDDLSDCDDPPLPKVGTRYDLRVADFFAHKISRLNGAPDSQWCILYKQVDRYQIPSRSNGASHQTIG
jgi:hypothetical protein